MAKLYYRYGAMGSSKTANALMVKYNYEERGQNVLLTKPAVDTRDGVHKIVSRCGLESECTLFEDINEDNVTAAQPHPLPPALVPCVCWSKMSIPQSI